jgi:predicted nucleic acid-binding protein
MVLLHLLEFPRSSNRGPIEARQALLNEAQFGKVNNYFLAFPSLELERWDYLDASRLRSHCRSKGVSAGPVDFLIAAACIHWNYPL